MALPILPFPTLGTCNASRATWHCRRCEDFLKPHAGVTFRSQTPSIGKKTPVALLGGRRGESTAHRLEVARSFTRTECGLGGGPGLPQSQVMFFFRVGRPVRELANCLAVETEAFANVVFGPLLLGAGFCNPQSFFNSRLSLDACSVLHALPTLGDRHHPLGNVDAGDLEDGRAVVGAGLPLLQRGKQLRVGVYY